ncbi:MAG: hypothetical protein QG577_1077, partial [Thermodesulfobacteriota bacterium]|nr:hypothetical protein [Thermodesulfobacteriota bacterium]
RLSIGLGEHPPLRTEKAITPPHSWARRSKNAFPRWMMSEFMIADPWAVACIKGDRHILSLEVDNVNVIPGPV